MENNKRKLMSVKDLIVIGVILVIAILLLFFNRPKPDEKLLAHILYDGNEVMEIDLSVAQNEVFRLAENENVAFEIKEGKIRFVDTNCPDKLCENVGFLDMANEVSICLPNKVSLKLTGNNSEVDIIVN